MFNKLGDQLLYDLHETSIALEQILEQCAGPIGNNPYRLDLAAIERVRRLLDTLENTTETEINETGETDADLLSHR